MKKWQKNRNYKRIKDKDGNVVANIITVFGQDIEVSDEIFDTYSQMDRRANISERIFPQRAKYRWNARLRMVYISKRWKTQN